MSFALFDTCGCDTTDVVVPEEYTLPPIVHVTEYETEDIHVGFDNHGLFLTPFFGNPDITGTYQIIDTHLIYHVKYGHHQGAIYISQINEITGKNQFFHKNINLTQKIYVRS